MFAGGDDEDASSEVVLLGVCGPRLAATAIEPHDSILGGAPVRLLASRLSPSECDTAPPPRTALARPRAAGCYGEGAELFDVRGSARLRLPGLRKHACPSPSPLIRASPFSSGCHWLRPPQVYAPVDTPRQLCIWGCNKGECSAASSGWRVIRHQIRPAGLGCSTAHSKHAFHAMRARASLFRRHPCTAPE